MILVSSVEIEFDPVIEKYVRKYFSLEKQVRFVSIDRKEDVCVLKCAPRFDHGEWIENCDAEEFKEYMQNLILGITFMHYRLEPKIEEESRFSSLGEP